MNTKPSVRLVKKEKHKGPKPEAEVQFAVDSSRWATSVRSWVTEFQQHRRGESLPAFDSLFKLSTAPRPNRELNRSDNVAEGFFNRTRRRLRRDDPSSSNQHPG